MEYISKERIKEILNTYETKKDLFNWCDEYKSFINECVSCCVSSEWDYMLKKSYEDNGSPCNYEDLDLFSMDIFMDILEYEFNNSDENIKKDIINLFDEDLKTFDDLKEYILNNMDNEEVKNLINDELSNLICIDLSECEAEVYEWWIIQNPLKYRLEEQEEIFLNGAWGRQTTGQSISLDYCCISAFIDFLKDRL